MKSDGDLNSIYDAIRAGDFVAVENMYFLRVFDDLLHSDIGVAAQRAKATAETLVANMKELPKNSSSNFDFFRKETPTDVT